MSKQLTIIHFQTESHIQDKPLWSSHTAHVRALTDSKPPLIHHHSERQTRHEHLAQRQTNFAYNIQQKEKQKTPQSYN